MYCCVPRYAEERGPGGVFEYETTPSSDTYSHSRPRLYIPLRFILGRWIRGLWLSRYIIITKRIHYRDQSKHEYYRTFIRVIVLSFVKRSRSIAWPQNPQELRVWFILISGQRISLRFFSNSQINAQNLSINCSNKTLSTRINYWLIMIQ